MERFRGQKVNPAADKLYTGYQVPTDVIEATIAGGAASWGQGPVGAQPGMRPPTGQRVEAATARPTTAITAVGYKNPKQKVDRLQPDAAPPLERPAEDNPEFVERKMQKEVHHLIEESASALAQGNAVRALERAKLAGRKERALDQHRKRFQLNTEGAEGQSLLTFAVCFNLARTYEANSMFKDALATYDLLVKSKRYSNAERLRVNMGHIHYKQGNFAMAIKMYRMAMDKLATVSHSFKFKVMKNIGVAFLKLGELQDAIQNFEKVMEEMPDVQVGFNLVVCYYALGQKDKMKRAFLQLMGCKELPENCLPNAHHLPGHDENDGINDELEREQTKRRQHLESAVLKAAQLIAPVIETDLDSGFNWVIEKLRSPLVQAVASPRSDSSLQDPGFPKLALRMEIAKGVSALKRGAIDEAIDTFQLIEKKSALEHAATNLSFLYFLQGDLKAAERYADLAVKADRYNARALVNKANLLALRDELESAKELYLEAIGVEADCVEAIYNLGLVSKRMNHLEEALQAFSKLHRIVPKDAQVIYHIASLYEQLDDVEMAIEWFTVLHSAVRGDARVLARLGALYAKTEHSTEALTHYRESYNLDPTNMEVMSWLYVWFVRQGDYTTAVRFFERAAQLEPHEVKWRLMVGSCYRHLKDFSSALKIYRQIYAQEPTNVECLKYLAELNQGTEEGARFSELYLQQTQQGRPQEEKEEPRYEESRDLEDSRVEESRDWDQSMDARPMMRQQQQHPQEIEEEEEEEREREHERERAIAPTEPEDPWGEQEGVDLLPL